MQIKNILAAYLTDELNGSERIYSYNFSCPNVVEIGLNESLSAKNNIFNISNFFDAIPTLPTAYFDNRLFTNMQMNPFKGKWKRFGVDYTFYDTGNLSPWLFNLGDRHQMWRYWDNMRNVSPNKGFDNMWDMDYNGIREAYEGVVYGVSHKITSVLGFECPVDVVIKDSSGENALIIENNNPEFFNGYEEHIYVYIDGDKKYLYMDDQIDPNVEIVATDKGTLQYIVARENDGESTKIYSDVVLEKDKTFVSDASQSIETQNVELKVVDSNGDVIADVQQDGTEVLKEIPVDSITINKGYISLVKGTTETLIAIIKPNDATNKIVLWSSSNPNIATVSNGKVTAVSAGTATITVKTADGGKTATCKVTVKEDKVVAFVTRLYKLCLNREPDGPGLNDWVNKLKTKQITAAEAVQGFFYSSEMNRLNLSDDEWIERCYKVMMDRSSDAGGKAYWKGVLREQMKKDVLKGFIDSPEFTKICQDYGITKGTISDPTGLKGFVARCYNKVLRRDYDEAGLNSWVNEINNGRTYGKTRKERAINVASKGFFNSQEYLKQRTSNEMYVKTLYRTFLGREADEHGMKDWLGKLNSGRMNREQVLMGFAGSQEFLGILKSYGIQ